MNKMKDFNFVTIGDSNFFEPILLSLKQVNKFYPESKFFIYDWGFTKEQKKKLEKNKKVSIIPWRLRYPNLINTKLGRWNIKQGIIHHLKQIRNVFFDKIKNNHHFMGFESRIYNKALCIADMAERTTNNFIFIDGDAFLINEIDEFFKADFDIGVTLRRKNEIRFEKDKCNVLNSGVIFFLGNKKKNDIFIKSWISELKNTQERIAEQTSLTRLLQKRQNDIFKEYSTTHSLNFSDIKIRVSILPCEIYNYNWIEEFDVEKDKGKVKILHFKSGRFKTPLFEEIKKKLDL